eukprot:NODE_3251_length_810_cov_422.406623.p1 GENE.NODE_3251_length_810_cov_422.406623~~NODE_3251_length_810_cov_422.406623.p1  ORF type:complete len:200 (+),score=70.11 NODE_3251_length_810_cov_422.406623:99-698(+)
MGIDIKAGGHIKRQKRCSKTTNPYMRLLIKLYKFLARRTDSKMNKVIHDRLNMARRNRNSISLLKVKKLFEAKKNDDWTAVAVCTVTDDDRLATFDELAGGKGSFPKMDVVALHFTEAARKRIVKAGGECLTFDQFALRHPGKEKGRCMLVRGPRWRKQNRHFGKAPGVPNSKTAPYVRNKGRKFEKARGRRKSRGYKV